jgi:hypothetical protein
VASAIICFLLLLSEMATYSRVEVVNHMIVDSTTSAGIVPINFRITFPVVPCKGGRTRSFSELCCFAHASILHSLPTRHPCPYTFPSLLF